MLKQRRIVWSLLLIGALLLGACQSNTAPAEATDTPAPTQAQEKPSATPTEAPQVYCQGTRPTEDLVDVRPIPVYAVDSGEPGAYIYREFIQTPINLAWGPDGNLYVGDSAGKHVVVLGPDGGMRDLGLWQVEEALRADGPRGVAFDSRGCLYINNHGHIYQVDINTGYLNEISGVHGLIGGIAFSPDDELYYSDRNEETGSILKWVPEDNRSQVVVPDLPRAENLVFDQDGNLFVTQLGYDTVLKVNVDTGEVSEFASGVCGNDPCYLAFDAEGDLWVRSIFYLHQIGPDGQFKPHNIDGTTFDVRSGDWRTSGGIAFDDEGGLWIASYNSRLWRLAPAEASGDTPAFSTTTIAPGFTASDLALDSQGNLYTADENTSRVLRISPGGEVEVLWDYDGAGLVGVAVSPADELYLGMPFGRLVRLGEDGSTETIAQFVTRRMVFAGDGQLYAVSGDWGQAKSIVRVSPSGGQSVIAAAIDGTALGNGEVHITPALDTGLYVFTEAERNLFYLDFEGEGHLIANLGALGGGSGPTVMAASPTTGDIFYVPHGPYEAYRIDPEGASELFLRGVYGDPAGMVVSADGRWLYIVESGVIDKIAIP